MACMLYGTQALQPPDCPFSQLSCIIFRPSTCSQAVPSSWGPSRAPTVSPPWTATSGTAGACTRSLGPSRDPSGIRPPLHACCCPFSVCLVWGAVCYVYSRISFRRGNTPPPRSHTTRKVRQPCLASAGVTLGLRAPSLVSLYRAAKLAPAHPFGTVWH